MKEAIVIDNINKKLGDFCLENISFTVPEGSIMGFVGPNGAGKSSIIKLILNSISPDSGSIHMFGLDNSTHSKQIKQRIGFVHGEDFYSPQFTLKTIKKIVAPFYKEWDEKLFQHYVKKFQLPLKKRVQKVSTGTKRKFSLALALSHHADILILDEPTSGLDPLVRTELMDILIKVVRDENKTVLFSTHITSDLEQIADYITFINSGKLLLSKAKGELLDTYHLVKGSRDVLTNRLRPLLVGIRELPMEFEALTDQVVRIRDDFAEQVILKPASIEEIFIHLVRGDVHV